MLTQLSIPSAPEIEMLVLGAMMSSEKNLESALDELTEKDFTTVANICIFRAILSCAKNEIAVDCHTVTRAILDSGSLRLLPSNSYVVDCVQSSYIDIEIASKCQILKDKSAHRALLLAHNSTTALLSKPIENITDAIEQVRQLFFKIDLPRREERLSLGEIAKADLEKTKANYKTYLELGHVPKDGLDTGFAELDKIIDMAPGNLVIVAARPGVGKTAFALNMLYQQGCEMKIPSVFFSLEMSNQEIYRRLLSIHTRIPQSRLKSYSLSESEIRKIEEAAIYFGDCPVYLYDITEPRISDIRAKCRRLKESSDVKVVFIDFLQLVKGSTRSYENRQTEMSDVSRTLKLMAKELSIPVVCLAQLSRRTEDRDKKIPVLSDLRESGAIEQDSDVCMFLSRPSLYDQYDKPGIVEVRVLKNRHGETKHFDLIFKGETQEFGNIDKTISPINVID